MPYIKIKDRQELEKRSPKTAGELNYLITHICKRYLTNKKGHFEFDYQKLNDVVGALEGCKLEFYARIVRPYEDKKITENGDVF